mgnify:CR=1 FL=1
MELDCGDAFHVSLLSDEMPSPFKRRAQRARAPEFAAAGPMAVPDEAVRERADAAPLDWRAETRVMLLLGLPSILVQGNVFWIWLSALIKPASNARLGTARVLVANPTPFCTAPPAAPPRAGTMHPGPAATWA